MRESAVYKNINTQHFKEKLLNWAQSFSHVAYYDSNNYTTSPGKFSYQNYHCIIAIDKISELIISEKDNFNRLKSYHKKIKDWIFGFLSYDLKNEIENLQSANSDKINMPVLNFFQPKYIFFINDNKIKVEFNNDYTPRIFINSIIKQIKNYSYTYSGSENINLQERVTKKEYVENVNQIKTHIHLGDIYEMNYCIEFFSDEAVINPIEKYKKLNKLSPAPFSCFYKLYDKFLLSASPERFLMKNEETIVSQPIKGTAKRGLTIEEDQVNK
jgi:para-aminobenzoate synthetase component 1